MTIAPRQAHGQRQTLGFRQMQAIAILRLTNDGLAEHLARRATANPWLRLRMPAGAAPATESEPADTGGGLYAHVAGQLGLIGAARGDAVLATAFVEALDANGWLDRPLAEIATGAGRSLRQAESMLAALQQGIEPVGLFARDLADCLRLQAEERGHFDLAMERVLCHLPLVARRGPAAVAAATNLSPDVVATCLDRIRRMDPRPGLAFGDAPTPLRAPDVIVSRAPDGWRVELNRSNLPAVTLAPAATVPAALRQARTEAEWLVGIVERRNHTVLAIARAVLLRQSGFLDHGPGALIALRRVEIAAGLGLHDTTVGRVARDLLVATPHGLRSLCSLFDGGPGAVTGDGLATPASAAIRHRIAEIIATENPTAPLSDGAVTAILQTEGKSLARRTVAKFRDELGIPARSVRRRRIAV